MILGLFRRDPKVDAVDALYASLVEHARQPAFYLDYGVADTPEGRFELLLLHVALVFRRLSADAGEGRDAAQLLAERFFTDMNRSLRELGIGDLSVPKKLKKVAQGFYGRLGAYDAAIAGGAPAELASALARNVLDRPEDDETAALLARYVRAAAEALAAAPVERVIAAGAILPDAAAMIAKRPEA